MAFLIKNSLKMNLSKQFLHLQQRNLSICSVIFNPHKQNTSAVAQNESKNSTTQKKKESIKITLLQNQSMTITGLEEAKNLAKRRSMHLVKIQDMDTKTQRPVYKLLTAAEMLQNELAELKNTDKGDKPAAAQKKSEKSLSIGSRIGEHDLQSRLKNISKWLNKQHEVRILIQGNSEQDLGNCEKVFKVIEENVKTPQIIGKIVQKRTKGNIVKFNILPVPASSSQ